MDKFSSQNHLTFQKSDGINKLLNFKDFSRPIKEIKYFSRRLLKFKTFSRLYEPWFFIGRKGAGGESGYFRKRIEKLLYLSLSNIQLKVVTPQTAVKRFVNNRNRAVLLNK